MAKATCSVMEGGTVCGLPVHGDGYCKKHNARLKRHGDPLVVVKHRFNTMACYMQKVLIGDECFGWTGATGNGYAQLGIEGKTTKVHRWVYETFVGPIPEDYDVDHVCHNKDESCPGGITCPHRRCTRPDHLEAVPHRENVLRSSSAIPAVNARKTCCPRCGGPYSYKRSGERYCKPCRKQQRIDAGEISGKGRPRFAECCPLLHPYDDENTGWKGPDKTHRYCKACARARARRHYEAKKARGK